LEVDEERIVKIGLHLPESWSKVTWFFGDALYSASRHRLAATPPPPLTAVEKQET